LLDDISAADCVDPARLYFYKVSGNNATVFLDWPRTHRCNRQPKQQVSQPHNGLEVQSNTHTIYCAQMRAAAVHWWSIFHPVLQLEEQRLKLFQEAYNSDKA
jgi:hypothetical protein